MPQDPCIAHVQDVPSPPPQPHPQGVWKTRNAGTARTAGTAGNWKEMNGRRGPRLY